MQMTAGFEVLTVAGSTPRSKCTCREYEYQCKRNLFRQFANLDRYQKCAKLSSNRYKNYNIKVCRRQTIDISIKVIQLIPLINLLNSIIKRYFVEISRAPYTETNSISQIVNERFFALTACASIQKLIDWALALFYLSDYSASWTLKTQETVLHPSTLVNLKS